MKTNAGISANNKLFEAYSPMTTQSQISGVFSHALAAGNSVKVTQNKKTQIDMHTKFKLTLKSSSRKIQIRRL